MKIQILGTGNGFETNLGTTSFLAWNGDMTSAILFDCGWSVFAELRRLEIETKVNIIPKIDTCFISHLHEDHAGTAGLLALYKAYIHGKPLKFIGIDTLPRYLSLVLQNAEISGSADNIWQYKEFGEFEIIKNDHGGMPTCGILKDGIYYSGDTQYSMLESDVAKRAKIIIHETQEHDEFHPQIKDLATAPADIRAKTYLTHYRENEQSVLEAAAKEYGFAGVCRKGQEIEF